MEPRRNVGLFLCSRISEQKDWVEFFFQTEELQSFTALYLR